tara:strand:- start:434 stop:604 length:171 start_codon:yes stop_codon:yes gene_type:complete
MSKKKRFIVTKEFSSEEYCHIDAYTLEEAKKIAENESLDWQLEWQTDEIEVEEWEA